MTKVILLGDSGTGKTGALASLAAAGLNLRVLDYDSGLEVLKHYLTEPTSPYVKADAAVASRLSYVTLRDPMMPVNGRLVPRKAVAWQKGVAMLDDWRGAVAYRDGKWQPAEESLGKVTAWTDRDVLVMDSSTGAAERALNFHLGMNGKLAAVPTQNEYRRNVNMAQVYLENMLEMLSDDSLPCHVVIISHIKYVRDRMEGPPPEGEDWKRHGYPSAIGEALSERIPRRFNAMLLAKIDGEGPAARKKIYTQSQGVINLKTTAPLRVQSSYPIETGLADYFKVAAA